MGANAGGRGGSEFVPALKTGFRCEVLGSCGYCLAVEQAFEIVLSTGRIRPAVQARCLPAAGQTNPTQARRSTGVRFRSDKPVRTANLGTVRASQRQRGVALPCAIDGLPGSPFSGR
ncbi:MAG: hypothetical protein D6690_14560 [Nitrospirae bacterium]|nr:MAG: hypothetical protein D6690_14560 [Nitrospirota bacterium]